MFLAEGQRVSLGEILLGLSVSSGNDAAVALALHFAPSVEAFTSLMNAEAKRLSLNSTRFAEPSGISAAGRTTALDFARFCRAYLTEHPEAPVLLHRVKEFAYPQEVNTPGSRPGTIVQYNHNTFLHLEGAGGIEGLEGLKTGYIDEAGYNIALSAKRGATRLIAVILGAETEGQRDADGRALLEWGFANYRTMSFSPEFFPQAHIWKGKERSIQTKPGGGLELTLSRRRGSVLEIDMKLRENLEAPLPSGYEAGTFTARDEEGELLRIPLVLAADAEEGGFFRRLFDGIRLFFRKLFS
jgi:D-alanyl-D-alanine carboxypeptidase (penicillin-binding protein 5/6)